MQGGEQQPLPGAPGLPAPRARSTAPQPRASSWMVPPRPETRSSPAWPGPSLPLTPGHLRAAAAPLSWPVIVTDKQGEEPSLTFLFQPKSLCHLKDSLSSGSHAWTEGRGVPASPARE